MIDVGIWHRGITCGRYRFQNLFNSGRNFINIFSNQLHLIYSHTFNVSRFCFFTFFFCGFVRGSVGRLVFFFHRFIFVVWTFDGTRKNANEKRKKEEEEREQDWLGKLNLFTIPSSRYSQLNLSKRLYFKLRFDGQSSFFIILSVGNLLIMHIDHVFISQTITTVNCALFFWLFCPLSFSSASIRRLSAR